MAERQHPAGNYAGWKPALRHLTLRLLLEGVLLSRIRSPEVPWLKSEQCPEIAETKANYWAMKIMVTDIGDGVRGVIFHTLTWRT